MRVYGSSPLYNYVELIFRSKRLFIASVVVTTLVVAGAAAMRAGTYTAKALVLLSGSAANTANTEDSGQRGSISYKLNILNIVLKDPNFMKEAMREQGLDKGKTDDDFDKFCKDARNAMQYARGENVLEI